MKVVFADTYYYLAWVNPRDAAHRATREFAAKYSGKVITTWAVLLEVGDAFCHRANRQSFLRVLDDIENDVATTILPIGQEFLERGIELFRDRPDKDWSLTDCISFEVMTEMELMDALPGDHHFEQAGFNILLKP